MTASLESLITGAIGEDSGWRVESLTQETALMDINVIAGTVHRLVLQTPYGMPVSYHLRQGAVGVPSPMSNEGWDGAQEFFRTRVGKIFTGPLGRSGVHESDLRGLYRSLSLGLSTEGSQNITLIWFGDWGTGLSAIFSAAPHVSIPLVVGGATAVAIIASGDSGAHTAIGHCW